MQEIPIFKVFALTWSELKPMIYHIQGEHTNHNTTDAVVSIKS